MQKNVFSDFIYALFDFAETNNSNTNLSDAALRSLVSLGVKKHKMFINAVHTFLLDNGKKVFFYFFKIGRPYPKRKAPSFFSLLFITE